MVMAAITLAYMQKMRQGMAAALTGGPVLRDSTVAWEQRSDLNLWQLGLERNQKPTPAKSTRRVSRRQFDYNASALGVILANMKALHLENQLAPACTLATEFSGHFGVPHHRLCFSLVKKARTSFSTVHYDGAHRNCVLY